MPKILTKKHPTTIKIAEYSLKILTFSSSPNLMSLLIIALPRLIKLRQQSTLVK